MPVSTKTVETAELLRLEIPLFWSQHEAILILIFDPSVFA
jgi:hypothetical protein